MRTIISHVDIRLAEKRERERRQRPISYRVVERETGVPQTTVSDLASNQLLEFPEAVLVCLCEYLECPLYGPNGLLEIVDVPGDKFSERRLVARQRLQQRKERLSGAVSDSEE